MVSIVEWCWDRSFTPVTGVTCFFISRDHPYPLKGHIVLMFGLFMLRCSNDRTGIYFAFECLTDMTVRPSPNPRGCEEVVDDTNGSEGGKQGSRVNK